MGNDPGTLQRLPAFELGEPVMLKRARAAAQAGRDLYAQGPGEPTAVHHTDVLQGRHNDCFLMAAMAAIARQHPDPDRWMRDLIEVNPDGTYTVTLYEWIAENPITHEPASYRRVTEVVHEALPGPATSDENGEKWVAVIEKAYAQHFPTAAGAEPFPRNTGADPADAMSRLTGLPSQPLDLATTSIDRLAELQAKGYALTATAATVTTGLPDDTASHHPLYQPGGLTPNGEGWPAPLDKHSYNDELRTHHVYYVTGVDRAAGTVTVNNVWDVGRQDIVIPYDQFRSGMASLDANPVHTRERPR
jgi:hypothetical protein